MPGALHASGTIGYPHSCVDDDLPEKARRSALGQMSHVKRPSTPPFEHLESLHGRREVHHVESYVVSQFSHLAQSCRMRRRPWNQ
jgi:hypothetical protein